MSVHDFEAVTITGQRISLSEYCGKVMVIVNTASKCGFTPQYKELEALYQQYRDELVVLGFPCDQFGHQEPGNEAEISTFCELNYGVTFPLFSKVEVNGSGANPLFTYLKKQAPGVLGSRAIKWNFTKFLVDQEGCVVCRFAPKDKPLSLVYQIKNLLAAKV